LRHYEHSVEWTGTKSFSTKRILDELWFSQLEPNLKADLATNSISCNLYNYVSEKRIRKNR